LLIGRSRKTSTLAIQKLYLQMMNDARLTTGIGVTHDLSGYYIVLTSNVGADKLMNSRKLNFSTIEKSIKNTLSQQGYRDEFISRFNEIIVFKMLDYETMREIALLNIRREIGRIEQLLEEKYSRSISLKLTPEIVELTIMEGTNSRLGARPIRNFVETSLQNAVTKKILAGELPQGKVIQKGSSFVIV
jgi:ATP-dependent Clp protease ATP-binding subunit ClpA